jgi:hypothetical protein
VGPPLKALELLKEFFFHVLHKVGFSRFGAIYCSKNEAFAFVSIEQNLLISTKPMHEWLQKKSPHMTM